MVTSLGSRPCFSRGLPGPRNLAVQWVDSLSAVPVSSGLSRGSLPGVGARHSSLWCFCLAPLAPRRCNPERCHLWSSEIIKNGSGVKRFTGEFLQAPESRKDTPGNTLTWCHMLVGNDRRKRKVQLVSYILLFNVLKIGEMLGWRGSISSTRWR